MVNHNPPLYILSIPLILFNKVDLLDPGDQKITTISSDGIDSVTFLGISPAVYDLLRAFSRMDIIVAHL
jgi:hypothetical protein